MGDWQHASRTNGIVSRLKKAARWYKKWEVQERKPDLWSRATEGDAKAQTMLGLKLHVGDGVEGDQEKAVYLFRKAANHGHSTAQYFLGLAYMRGEGVQEDSKLAALWFKKSADQGDPLAQGALGVLHEEGRGVEQDWEEAVRLFQRGADQGDATCQFNLGEKYAEGLGVQQDWSEAFSLFEEAACGRGRLLEPGQEAAKLCLAWLLWTGVGGVKRDRPRAERLCEIVSETEGYEDTLAEYTIVGPFWPGVLAWFRRWVEGGSDAWEADSAKLVSPLEGKASSTSSAMTAIGGFSPAKVEELRAPAAPSNVAPEIERAQKVRLIFEKFDRNQDGALNKMELANLFIAVNPRIAFNEAQVTAILNEIYRTYGDYIIDQRGLSLDGLKRSYDDGGGDIDRDFAILNLYLPSITGEVDPEMKGPRASLLTGLEVDQEVTTVAASAASSSGREPTNDEPGVVSREESTAEEQVEATFLTVPGSPVGARPIKKAASDSRDPWFATAGEEPGAVSSESPTAREHAGRAPQPQEITTPINQRSELTIDDIDLSSPSESDSGSEGNDFRPPVEERRRRGGTSRHSGTVIASDMSGAILAHEELLKELKAFLDSSGGFNSLPVVPDEKSRRLLQSLLLDKRRLVEVEERMRRSAEASAYFTEMHKRLGDLFVGAQALSSGKVHPTASMPFLSIIFVMAQHALSELPFLKALVGAASMGFQAWDANRVCNAAEKVCRVAPAGLAQTVARAVALGLALGREEVVRVLWGGGAGYNVSISQLVRQRWGVLMGLSQQEARLRGLVEDDLARMVESILAKKVQGVPGDTDGVEVSRKLIDVGLQSKASPAAVGGMQAMAPPITLGQPGPINPVGGVVAVQRIGSPQVQNKGASFGSNSHDVAALHERIKDLELKLLEHDAKLLERDAEVRSLRSDLTRAKGGPSANERGGQGDGMMLMLQADGSEETRRLTSQMAQLQRQLDDHQAALVGLRPEIQRRGHSAFVYTRNGRASSVRVRLERDSRGQVRFELVQGAGGYH